MSIAARLEKFWYSQNTVRWLFFPLSFLILCIAVAKRLLYKYGIFKILPLDIPVIVVGNITVGGTGKTPFISFLSQQLQQKGLKVGIVSRGYRSNATSYPHIVSDDDTAEVVGDEAFMQYANTRIPIAIGANRSDAVKALTKAKTLDVIISDDGLQHYAMARNFEILMVDGQRAFGNTLMLPFGPLREPVSRISSVDYIIENGSCHYFDKLDSVNTPISSMKIVVKDLINLKSKEPVDAKILQSSEIIAVAGIGNPERFFDSLSRYSESFERCVFPDHHQFKEADFSRFKDQIIVMTEKDAVKCDRFARHNWYYLKVSATIDESEFERLYQSINQKILTSQ